MLGQTRGRLRSAQPRVVSPGGPQACRGICGPCMAVPYQEVVLGSCALGFGRTRAKTPGFGHAACPREPPAVGGGEGSGGALLDHGGTARSPPKGPDGKAESCGSDRKDPSPGATCRGSLRDGQTTISAPRAVFWGGVWFPAALTLPKFAHKPPNPRVRRRDPRQRMLQPAGVRDGFPAEHCEKFLALQVVEGCFINGNYRAVRPLNAAAEGQLVCKTHLRSGLGRQALGARKRCGGDGKRALPQDEPSTALGARRAEPGCVRATRLSSVPDVK